MKLNIDEVLVKINEEIEKTKISITELISLTKPISPDCAIGRISRMDAINNKTINDAALKNAKLKLKGLEIALRNVNDDDFGICVRCENKIPIGRILIMPQSRFCVHCAS